jgi:hypothetical protein
MVLALIFSGCVQKSEYDRLLAEKNAEIARLGAQPTPAHAPSATSGNNSSSGRLLLVGS